MTDFLKVLNFKQQLDKQTFKQALLHPNPNPKTNAPLH